MVWFICYLRYYGYLPTGPCRQSQLSLLEHHCSAKEAELNALKGQRDMCMKQLEEAHLAIARQEKK